MAKGRKFRDIKSECKELVESYREENDDWRKVPEFHIGSVSRFGRKGFIQLTRKVKGGEPVYSNDIAYESLPELVFIIENLGKAWERSNR